MRHDFRPVETLPFTSVRTRFPQVPSPRLFAAVGLLLAAAGVATAAALSASHWLDAEAERRAGKLAAPIATAEVWVAHSDLQAGKPFSPAMVQLTRWPAAAVPSSAVVGAKTRLLGLAGRRLAVDVPKGSPLVEGHLLERGAGNTLSHRLARGMRAVTVPVTASSGLAGLVRPGDRVDLLFSGALPDGRRISETVLVDVKVLGLDQQIEASAPVGQDTIGSGIPATVTLEVRPEAAESVAFLAEAGRLSLSLRGHDGDPMGQGEVGPLPIAASPAALLDRISAAFRAAEGQVPAGPVPPAGHGGSAGTLPVAAAKGALAAAPALEGGVAVVRGSSIRSGTGTAAALPQAMP